MHSRSGTTVLELLVVLAIIGTFATVVGLGALAFQPPPADEPLAEQLAVARRQAVASGRMVTLSLYREDAPLSVTALPDGSMIGAEDLGFDRLSGRPVR